ncbi:MAG: metallophosphoesterase [Oscillospiraceae bacterium]|nr:metallophosphoesterase [Oscillospiraceae bacterium]
MYNKIEVTRYAKSSNRIKSKITIALIADLHCSDYGRNQFNLVKLIKKGSPDIILLAGDIFHHFGKRQKGHELIKEAVKIAPVFYIAGNHEKKNPDYFEILNEVKFLGGFVLDNEVVETVVNDNALILAGGDKSAIMKSRLREYFGNSGHFKLMLNHYPENYRDFTDDFDMMMSGHLHGGQIRIPYIMPNGIYAQKQGLFPKYTGNAYDITDKFTLVVSRGISVRRSGRFRVFNRPELVFMDILPG